MTDTTAIGTAPIDITDHPDRHRWEATIGGQVAGICEYNLLTDAVMFTHTEVMTEFEGRGVGSALARRVLDAARANGQHVIPVCQFIAAYIRKHREYADLVRPDVQRAFKI
jgi:predicted GNAT family acetyltransferase